MTLSTYQIFGGLVTGLGFLVLVAALTSRSRNLLQERLVDEEDPKKVVVGEDWEGTSIRQRIFSPIAELASGVVNKLVPAAQLKDIETTLSNLGNPGGLTAGTFVALVVVLTVGLLALGLLVSSFGGLTPPLSIVVPVVFALGGVMYPRIKLQRLAKNRRKEIVLSLPDMLDLLTICVEAGLTIDAGIREIAFAYDNALALEFRRLLNEINLGRPRDEALALMAERNAVDELSSLSSAVIQSQRLGSGIGQTLRVQSEEVRRLRRQKAEESAQRAPLKMLFPMVLCIFPAIFLVLLGPAVVLVMSSAK